MQFTIGCDPEIFLIRQGRYKSAVGLIGGSKWAPKPIENGGAILEDNVAVEFNTPPADSATSFRSAVEGVLGYVRSILPGYDFSQESAVSFPVEELQTPEAQEFGCEPDYNAWKKAVNPKPAAPDPNLRSCGGHVHVGSELAINDPIGVIRAMDLFLGVPSTQLDSGTLRRSLYGKAGCFRFKPYGVEYRTLSNFWIFNPAMIEWVYEQTDKALSFVGNGSVISDTDGEIVQQCINNSDKAAYEYLANAYGLGHTS